VVIIIIQPFGLQGTVVVAPNAGPENATLVLVVVHPGTAVVVDDDDDAIVVFVLTMAQGLTSGASGSTIPMSGGGEEISTIPSTMTKQCNGHSLCPSHSGQSLEQGCGLGNATGMACDGGG